MRKLIFGILGLLWLLAPPLAGLTPAQAQQVNLYCYQGPTNPQWAPCASGNPLSVNATVSASITGFPGTTQTTGTPIEVTTGGFTGTLPSGTEVVASNVGTTNNAYCKLGASATTSDQLIAPNSWFGFTVGSNSQLTCITSTSTTTVNMVGGSGLPTGAGGGGGGGGGSNAAAGATGSAVPSSAGYNGLNIANGTLRGQTGVNPSGSIYAAQTDLSSVGGTSLAFGSAVSASSIPVVVASDQAAIAIKQTTASNLNATVVGTGTFATQAAQSGTWTNTVTQATGTNLHVVCDSGCSGSGGTSSSFGSAFPATGTALGLTNGTNMVAWSATSNYGTSPGAIAVPSVNAFVTNTTALGSALSAASSPVVIASDQAAVAVKAASGSIASGAIASGAVASGAYVSGSLASGAVVDITNMSATAGAALPAKDLAIGVNVDNVITAPHICGSHVFKHITTMTDTQLVAASGSQTIYVCDYSISFNGTGNIYLEKATTGTCATLTQIDQAWYGIANAGKVAANAYYQGLNTGASAQLCANTSAAVAIDISVNYDQY